MKSVVLFSGGLDSTTVLAMEMAAGHEVMALTVDYEQSNSFEIERCCQIASLWGFRHKVIKVQLERSDARQEIPARNTVFLAKALEQALIWGAERIAYGAEPDATYTDSSPEYISAMCEVMRLHGIELVAPIRNMTGKKEVLQKALDLGVPLDLVHSSRTNRVNGGCSASNRFLVTLQGLFPNIHPVRLLSAIANAHAVSNCNPYDIRTEETGSFKFLPALFTIASLKEDTHKDRDVTVYTTGNWGKSFAFVNETLIRLFKTVVIAVPPAEDCLGALSKNEFNTNCYAAQWGMKQALSRLPRPQFMRSGLRFRVVQGHLRKAVLELGYREDQTNGIELITE